MLVRERIKWLSDLWELTALVSHTELGMKHRKINEQD